MNTFWILMFAVFGLMDCKQKKNNDEKKKFGGGIL